MHVQATQHTLAFEGGKIDERLPFLSYQTMLTIQPCVVKGKKPTHHLDALLSVEKFWQHINPMTEKLVSPGNCYVYYAMNRQPRASKDSEQLSDYSKRLFE